MTLFAALAGSGGAGLGGAAFGHWAVTAANRMGGETWLMGPSGPPFFSISLYMGVLLGAIAWALSRSPKIALLGFTAAFLGIVLPMAVLGRVVSWEGENWVRAVTVIYILATWGAMIAISVAVGRARPLAAAAAGAGGAFAGYLLLAGLLRLSPAYGQSLWSPTGIIPSPVALMDGLFTGAGMGTGLWLLLWRHHEKRSGT